MTLSVSPLTPTSAVLSYLDSRSVFRTKGLQTKFIIAKPTEEKFGSIGASVEGIYT